MNGHEKSDSVIVAAKPANKAAHSAEEQSAVEAAAAEPVEPRAETKGNADQQSTCRAQSRVSVSQALDRIRKVAKEKKKERFTALFHHISMDLLEEAFYELKENAAPGVDRLTWTDYEADLERRLEILHDRVQRGAYRALPSRRVYIPKPDGRQRPIRSPLDPIMQDLEPALEVCLVVRPRQSIHTRRGILLEFVECLFEQVHADVVEESSEPLLLLLLCDFPYAVQRL